MDCFIQDCIVKRNVTALDSVSLKLLILLLYVVYRAEIRFRYGTISIVSISIRLCWFFRHQWDRYCLRHRLFTMRPPYFNEVFKRWTNTVLNKYTMMLWLTMKHFCLKLSEFEHSQILEKTKKVFIGARHFRPICYVKLACY